MINEKIDIPAVILHQTINLNLNGIFLSTVTRLISVEVYTLKTVNFIRALNDLLNDCSIKCVNVISFLNPIKIL